jgi:hypothetical protein
MASRGILSNQVDLIILMLANLIYSEQDLIDLISDEPDDAPKKQTEEVLLSDNVLLIFLGI